MFNPQGNNKKGRILLVWWGLEKFLDGHDRSRWGHESELVWSFLPHLYFTVCHWAQRLPDISTWYALNTNTCFKTPCVWAPSTRGDSRRRGHACHTEAQENHGVRTSPRALAAAALGVSSLGGWRNLWTCSAQEGRQDGPSHCSGALFLVLWPCVIHLVTLKANSAFLLYYSKYLYVSISTLCDINCGSSHVSILFRPKSLSRSYSEINVSKALSLPPSHETPRVGGWGRKGRPPEPWPSDCLIGGSWDGAQSICFSGCCNQSPQT